MAAQGIPVTIVESGGMPVNPVDAGYPLMTVATNGKGMTITISTLGSPFIVQGYEPVEGLMFALSSDEGKSTTTGSGTASIVSQTEEALG